MFTVMCACTVYIFCHFAGIFKDYLGMYDPVFYIGGALLSVMSLVLLVTLVIQQRNASKQLKQNSAEQHEQEK